MWIDWKDALAAASGAMKHHLDELHIALVSLMQLVVTHGEDGGPNKDSSSIHDEIGVPHLLRREFGKAFLEGPEEHVAWYRASRCALLGLTVAGCYLHLLLQLGRLTAAAADDEIPAASQHEDAGEEEDGCCSPPPPKLQPSTPATIGALAEEDNDDDSHDDDDDDSSAAEEESSLASRASANEFDSLPRKTIFPNESVAEQMNQWSRGVTAALPPSTLDSWRRRLLGADGNDDDAVLRVFCGALWFRFHVHGQKLEEIISDANDLLDFTTSSKSARFERVPSINCLSIVEWAYRCGDNSHFPLWLDRLLETVYYVLSSLAESCKSRFQQNLLVSSCCVQLLIIEILRSDNSFIRYCDEHNRRASAAPATEAHPDTMQTVLRATARRLQSHLVLLNAIQVRHDGSLRINCRNPPGDSLLDPATSVGELECSLHLVRWCVASGALRADSSAVLGLLRQERMAQGRILQLGVPRAVESWFRDLRNIELAIHEDLETLIDPKSKAQCVRVLATCAIDILNGSNATCLPDEESVDDFANAFYRLGMCLAHNDIDRDLAVECLEKSHRAWSPVLRRSVVKAIPQRIKALEAVLSKLNSYAVDDGRTYATLQSLQVLLREAHTHLTTSAPASSTTVIVSPYWKAVQVLIELESSVPDAGFPVDRCDTTSYPDLEDARRRLRGHLEDTGRLCRFMASMLPVLSPHAVGDSGERGAIAGEPLASEIASLGRAIERLVLHKFFKV
jgi:hypothetical protein